MSALVLILVLLLASCSGPPPPPKPPYRDDRPLPGQPAERQPSLAEEMIRMTLGLQLKQAFDTPRLVRKLAGRPYEALNTDAFDRVPDSSWFTNRLGSRPMTPAAVALGPQTDGGPDTTAPWTVVAMKETGVTPGMTIVDSHKRRYIIKFDPRHYPELPSGTEAVLSRLFYAAGYHVPENYVAALDPARLQISPKAKVSHTVRGVTSKRPMTADDLRRLLEKVNPDNTARVRVLASRFLPGIPVGPWSYTGVRPDDPNDVYAHEHRREIRGLYILCAWLNHADMKEENTLDMYDPERRVLTHYLIDFGSSAGSNATKPSNPRRGQANRLDLKDGFVRLLTLGLYVHPYERASRAIRHPSVGYLDNAVFRPEAWKPLYPVPAFENMTKRDAFWGTRIVTAFSDQHLAAAVSTGAYSNPEAAVALTRFLAERRDRTGRYWLARLNPLDRFAVEGDSLRFADLAVDRGYAAAGTTAYRFEIATDRGEVLYKGRSARPRIGLEGHDAARLSVRVRPTGPGRRYAPVQVQVGKAAAGWQVQGIRRTD